MIDVNVARCGTLNHFEVQSSSQQYAESIVINFDMLQYTRSAFVVHCWTIQYFLVSLYESNHLH